MRVYTLSLSLNLNLSLWQRPLFRARCECGGRHCRGFRHCARSRTGHPWEDSRLYAQAGEHAAVDAEHSKHDGAGEAQAQAEGAIDGEGSGQDASKGTSKDASKGTSKDAGEAKSNACTCARTGDKDVDEEQEEERLRRRVVVAGHRNGGEGY